MAQNFPTPDPIDSSDHTSPPDFWPLEEREPAPSLPIILFSSACGLASGMIVLYVAYDVMGLIIELSMGVATFALLCGLGLSGAGLSALAGSRAALSNIGFSCGLILFTLLFFGLCILAGAVAATLFLFLGV